METRSGFRHLLDLPDDGPWRLLYWRERLFAHSGRSGLWEVIDNRLVSVAIAETPPIFADEFGASEALSDGETR